MIKKTKTGWAVDIRPAGREGRRFRKTFKTQGEAKSYERWVMREYSTEKAWLQRESTDPCTLKQLADVWYQMHGINNKYGKTTYKELLLTAKRLNNPTGANLKANEYVKYRIERLKSVSKKTANNELSNIKAMFNYLFKIGEINYQNPLMNVHKLKIDEQELSYLTIDQCTQLLDELKNHKGHAYLVTKICLSTGARWGEVIGLQATQLKENSITFTKTKSGRNRTLPIDENLIHEVKQKLPIIEPLSTFKRVVKALNWNLPKGQLTHVLRHTFASHLVMNGVDLVSVQKALGHSSLTMTMRYAHLSKNHLKEALKYNPLKLCGQNVGKPKN